MGDSEYSFSLTTFSPSGKLVQIEYALQAVSGGATSLAIKAKNGIVLATEKKPPALMDESTFQKITLLTNHIGMVYSGIAPDFRVLVRKGRKAAARYFRQYHEPIPVSQLVRELASVMQEFTQSGGVRPFGVSLLIAGFEEGTGMQLYQVDPSGSFFAWKATAIGKGMVNAKTFLEKRYSDELEIEDAIHTAILTLKEGFDGHMTEHNVEIGIVGRDGKFKVLSLAETKDYFGELQ